MEFVAMEYIDKYISDDALSTLEILTYLKQVGSHDLIYKIVYGKDADIKNRIGYRYIKKDDDINKENMIYNNHRTYRVNADDIIGGKSGIVKFLEKIDKHILDYVELEFLEEQTKKYGCQRASASWQAEPRSAKPTVGYARYYVFNDDRMVKKKDDNFLRIVVDVDIWSNFVKFARDRSVKVEDLFKVSIIRFLEKRLDVARNILCDKDNEIWYMNKNVLLCQ